MQAILYSLKVIERKAKEKKMYSDSEKVFNKIESLNTYLRNNGSRFCSLEEAFLAGYKKALEDAVDIMKEIKQKNSQSYN